MHFPIVLVMLAAILSAEYSPSVEIPDFHWRMLIVLIIVFANVCLAMLQSGQIGQLWKVTSDQSLVRRSLVRRQRFFYAIWIGSAASILFVVGWPQIVRCNMALQNWILVDEFLILLPVFLPLVTAWFVFAWWETEVLLSDPLTERMKRQLRKQRLKAFLDRFKFQLLLVLIPALIFFAFRDVSATINQYYGTGFPHMLVCLLLPVCLLAIMPICIRWLIQSSSILNTALGARQMETCRRMGIKLSDVRVWWTENQIVNAIVVGAIPMMRQMYFTDALLDRFNQEQIDAIARHEIAHLKRNHLLSRFLVLFLPVSILLSLMVVTSIVQGAAPFGSVRLTDSSTSCSWYLVAGIAVYGVLSLAIISRIFEHEADLIACCRRDVQQRLPAVDDARLDAYLSMLSQMKMFATTRITWLHPGIDSRTDLLLKFRDQPSRVARFTTACKCISGAVLLLNLLLPATIIIWYLC